MTAVGAATLVLTVLNEAEGLPAFLASVEQQELRPAEIVIVDGGSTDRTLDLLRAWPVPEGTTLVLDHHPGAGISEGRNRAFELASHEIVLVTDGGTRMHPRWIATMLAAFDAVPAPDVVSGFFEPVGDGFLERAIAFTVTPELSEIDGERFLPSSRSLAVTKSAWRAVGGYPEWLDYCEDLVFDLALKEQGSVFAFAPGAVVTWAARPSLRAFAKQYYRYARGDGKARLWGKRHAIRYSTYAGGLIALGASVAYPWILLVLAGGFGLYMRKFWIRVIRRRQAFGASWVRAAALVPVIVVVGDLAKMAGYPTGVRWRRSRDRRRK